MLAATLQKLDIQGLGSVAEELHLRRHEYYTRVCRKQQEVKAGTHQRIMRIEATVAKHV